MIQRAIQEIQLKVEFVPLPEERVPAWCAGLLLLFGLIAEDCNVAESIRMEDFIVQEVAYE